MPANTAPISPIAPNTGFAPAALLLANTALDGTGANIENFFTAGTNGSRVQRVRVVHRGQNVATVLRIFVNNGNVNTTAANNSLVAEVTMAANTLSQTVASVQVDVFLTIYLKPGYTLFYTIGTAVTAGFAVTAVDGGDY